MSDVTVAKESWTVVSGASTLSSTAETVKNWGKLKLFAPNVSDVGEETRSAGAAEDKLMVTGVIGAAASLKAPVVDALAPDSSTVTEAASGVGPMICGAPSSSTRVTVTSGRGGKIAYSTSDVVVTIVIAADGLVVWSMALSTPSRVSVCSRDHEAAVKMNVSGLTVTRPVCEEATSTVTALTGTVLSMRATVAEPPFSPTATRVGAGPKSVGSASGKAIGSRLSMSFEAPPMSASSSRPSSGPRPQQRICAHWAGEEKRAQQCCVPQSTSAAGGMPSMGGMGSVKTWSKLPCPS